MNEALTDLLKSLAAAPGHPLSDQELALLGRAAEEYPYMLPAVAHLAARTPADSPAGGRLRLRAAMMGMGHPEFDSIVEGGEWMNFYPAPEQPRTPATEEAIDTFLETFGSTSAGEEELLEKLIFNPVPDYSEVLAREEGPAIADEAPLPDSPEARIEAFIRENTPGGVPAGTEVGDILEIVEPGAAAEPAKTEMSPRPRNAAPEVHESSLLSESLARIYIKQGRYERAFEIISSLNLKFPKKSAYFADQLRFLRKLIINQRANEVKKQSPTSEN